MNFTHDILSKVKELSQKKKKTQLFVVAAFQTFPFSSFGEFSASGLRWRPTVWKH